LETSFRIASRGAATICRAVHPSVAASASSPNCMRQAKSKTGAEAPVFYCRQL
jgi:hypothetical protein